jgi:anti-anti-sigma regulatory factor
MDDLVSAARAYVREGLDRHEQVSFCRIDAEGFHHALISDVDEVGRPSDGELPVLAPFTHTVGWGAGSSSPIASFEWMLRAAVADGYVGLRVLTDATEVVRDLRTRPWWVRGEHLLDRYRLEHPLAVLCGYDADLVGDEVLAQVACFHALTGGTPSTFLLRATHPGGGLALSGEVDRASAAALYHAVIVIAADLAHPVVLDLSEQEFMDHSALVALNRAALALDTRIHLVGASALTGCLVDTLRLTRVVVRETT